MALSRADRELLAYEDERQAKADAELLAYEDSLSRAPSSSEVAPVSEEDEGAASFPGEKEGLPEPPALQKPPFFEVDENLLMTEDIAPDMLLTSEMIEQARGPSPQEIRQELEEAGASREYMEEVVPGMAWPHRPTGRTMPDPGDLPGVPAGKDRPWPTILEYAPEPMPVTEERRAELMLPQSKPDDLDVALGLVHAGDYILSASARVIAAGLKEAFESAEPMPETANMSRILDYSVGTFSKRNRLEDAFLGKKTGAGAVAYFAEKPDGSIGVLEAPTRDLMSLYRPEDVFAEAGLSPAMATVLGLATELPLDVLELAVVSRKAGTGLADFLAGRLDRKAFDEVLKHAGETQLRARGLPRPPVRAGEATVDVIPGIPDPRLPRALKEMRSFWNAPPGAKPSLKERAVHGWLKYRQHMVDDLAWVEFLEKRARGMKSIEPAALVKAGVDPKTSVTTMIRHLRNKSDSKAMFMVMHGTTDLAGNITGGSLRAALKPVGARWDELMDYMAAERALELTDRKIVSGVFPDINPTQQKEMLTLVRDHYQNMPEMRRASTLMREWNNNVWDYVEHAGGISHAARETMEALNQFYLPFARVLENDKLFTTVVKKHGMENAEHIGHLITGSKKQIQNPLTTLVQNTGDLIDMADRARIGRAFGDLAQLDGFDKMFPDIIEEIQTRGAAMKIKKSELRELLVELGVNPDKMPARVQEEIAGFFKAKSLMRTNDQNVVTFWLDGKQRAFSLHPEIYRTVKGLDSIVHKSFLSITAAGAARAVRLGATGLRPGFSLVTNPIRDIFTSAFQSEFGAHASLFEGMYRMMRKGDRFHQMYNAAGGPMSTFVGMDINAMKKTLYDIVEHDAAAGMKHMALHPGEALGRMVDATRDAFNFTEKGPRLAEFRKAYRAAAKVWGDGSEQALVIAERAAADITVDFGRAGIYSRLLNQYIPFWNAATQGVHRFARFYRQHPVKATIKLAGGLTAPSLVLWNMHKDEMWYQQLPAWEKAMFLHFHLGLNEDGSDNVLRIPLPFDWGVIGAGLPVAIADYGWQHGDTRKFGEQLGQMLGNFGNIGRFAGPIVSGAMGADPGMREGGVGGAVVGAAKGSYNVATDIAIFRPLADVFAGGEGGWDHFRDQPIDSHYTVENVKQPKDRFNAWTSQTARALGESLNYSPKKIDHLIYVSTGGLGSEAVRGVDWLAETLGHDFEQPSAYELGLMGWSEHACKRFADFWERERDHPSQQPVYGRLFSRTPASPHMIQKLTYDIRAETKNLESCRNQAKLYTDPNNEKQADYWRQREVEARQRIERIKTARDFYLTRMDETR